MRKAGIIGKEPEGWSGVWSLQRRYLEGISWGSTTTFVGYSYTNGISTLTADVPTEAVAGDILIFFATVATGSTFTTSDFTDIQNSNAKYVGYISSWNGTTSSYTVTKDSGTAGLCGIVAFRGKSFDVAGTISDYSAETTIYANSISVTSDNSILLFISLSTSFSLTWSNLPAGFTTIHNSNDDTRTFGYSSAYLAYKDVNSGSTGTTGIDVSSTNSAQALQLSLG